MNGVRFKAGVLPIAVLSPAGVRILGALDLTARRMAVDLIVTCADKEHGPDDPHTKGAALDIRSHDFSDDQKRLILKELMEELTNDFQTDAPVAVHGGLATSHFFGWIEKPGAVGEHFHVQQRMGTDYA